MLFRSEGEFHFEWLESIIDTLYQNGIYTILATPSGARPHWLADQYPEVLRVNEKREKHLFGLRHNHCYSSEAYKKKVKIINQELAKRFGQKESVILWHISNEYGGECHCPTCQTKFRNWLRDKYQTIEALNNAWCTTFWSHTYQSFEEVESPSSLGELSIQGLQLDFQRFVTVATTEFMKHEIDSLKEVGISQPVTTNFMYWYDGLNYYELSKAVDIISWDTYPTWHKEEEIVTARDCAMQHDYMRSLKKRQFLMMENCPSSTNWQSVSKLKKPGILTLASMQAISHGSNSVNYFQIRQSRGGEEKFHGAVIDHCGQEDSRVYQEVCRVGNALTDLTKLAKSNIKSKVAIVFDQENRWALQYSKGPRNKGMHYKESIMKSYDAIRRIGLNVDIIHPSDEFSEYEVIVAPILYLQGEYYPEKVERFVSEGGIYLATYWSGIVDENDKCYLGATPHKLTDVFGIRRLEIDALYDGETRKIRASHDSKLIEVIRETEESYCEYLCDLVKASSANVLLEYAEDFYEGMPALTENNYGKGKAYYICADFSKELYETVFAYLLEWELNLHNEVFIGYFIVLYLLT